ncbi:Hypothetical Protein FCC1311_027342 [Hondaea fermentalgiana]|uniref:Uncharacterized protein n=1 Tax=Hondaea fermentalgiana TaxID=2315210 RepID=A0A2R5GD36_9STRA|nr:Hypothetical Protein FCC1311_027342 [Hondaea fermentalgiana]|eukprot:GBG26513.1 Hypothetical Protein FCC1311_027342 [Hondaea fermentalgiana]
MSGSGYGICGHKNSFGANVLCGNWVEDKMGSEMAALTSTPKFDAISEAQHHFAHPDSRTRSGSAEDEAKLQTSKPSMRGLESTLLLGHCEHGNVHNPSSEGRFHTTHKLSFAPTPSSSSHKSGRRETGLARQKQMDAERRQRDPHHSTSYTVACQQPFRPQATLDAKPVMQRFSSDRAFTKAFVQAQTYSNIRSDRLSIEY